MGPSLKISLSALAIGIVATLLAKGLSILLFALMGGVLGLVFAWSLNQLDKGTTFFS